MNALRLVLFSILSLLEPLVTGIFSTLAILGFFTAGLFHWALPPGAPRHTGTLLGVSVAFAVGAAIYSGVTRLIAPR